MTEEFLQTKLNEPKSADTNSKDLTTYDYFDEKYNNFRKFIEELSIIHPEAKRVSAYLNVLALQEFREMIIPKLITAIMLHDEGNEDERNLECGRVIRELMQSNGFNINKLTGEQYSKAHRYCILFCVLLSDP